MNGSRPMVRGLSIIERRYDRHPPPAQWEPPPSATRTAQAGRNKCVAFSNGTWLGCRHAEGTQAVITETAGDTGSLRQGDLHQLVPAGTGAAITDCLQVPQATPGSPPTWGPLSCHRGYHPSSARRSCQERGYRGRRGSTMDSVRARPLACLGPKPNSTPTLC